MFGLGWFRDLWRMPDYVDDANEEASYIDNFKQKVKRGTPQFNVTRFAGQMLVGYFYGFLVRIAIPEDYPIWTTGLVVPFGVAVGVYLVGNVGRETGDFKIPLFVCYASNVVMAFIIKQEPGVMYVALFGAIAFQNYRKFRVERRPKRGVCKRFFYDLSWRLPGHWIVGFVLVSQRFGRHRGRRNGEATRCCESFLQFASVERNEECALATIQRRTKARMGKYVRRVC